MKTIATDLVCLACGNVATIQRKIGKQKNEGHRKNLWCYSCQKVTKHYEVKSIDSFMYDAESLNGEKRNVAKLVLNRRKKGT